MLGRKVNVLQKYIRLFGLTSLTDYDRRIFNKDFKNEKELTFINDTKSMKKEIEEIYEINIVIKTVDQSFKVLRKLLDECRVNYKSGRTMDGKYIELIRKDEGIEERLGNIVINKKQTYNKLIPLIQVLSEYANYGVDFAYIGTQFAKDKFIFDRYGECLYYLAIIFEMDEPNVNVHECIEYIKKGNTKWEMNNIIGNGNKVICIYKANKLYGVAEYNDSHYIKFNDKFAKYDVINVGFMGCHIFYRNDLIISKEPYIGNKNYKTIIDTIFRTGKTQLLEIKDKKLTCVYTDKQPTIATIYTCKTETKYDALQLNVIKNIVGKNKYCLPLYLEEIGISHIDTSNLNYIIEFNYENDEQVNYEIETLS